MSKFKVGDNVTIIHPDWKDTEYINEAFTIIKARHNYYNDELMVYEGELGTWEEDELELTSIVNSPLFNAMREISED